MERNEALKRVLSALSDCNLGLGLTELSNYLAAWPMASLQSQQDALRNEYELMLRYWKEGFREPRLLEIYNGLLHRLYVLYADASLGRRIGGSAYLSSSYSRIMSQPREWSVVNVRQELESFVSDAALIDLEPSNKQEPQREALYGRHFERMSNLFDYLSLSRVWSASTSSAFEEMLLSPTVDSLDQQLIVSALTLSLMNMFDINKFRLLVHVYQRSSDDAVRERALVGWVFGRNYTLSGLFPEEQQLIDELLTDEAVCHELEELQIQLIYCVQAEHDNEIIQSEIMPELMRNNQLRITREGIEEVEEDALDEILHPEADDERMERMEASISKMMNMQKEGSDIYFSGFSQMKRFPFFQQLSNWFLPYTSHHPLVLETMKSVKSKFLEKFVDTGVFCNSDKYSLVFAYQQVVDRLPQSVREMMEHGDFQLADVAYVDVQNPTFIRRMYLQDVYRFSRINHHAKEFDHPFKKDEGLGHILFFASPLFHGSRLESHFNRVTAHLVRRKLYDDAGRMLNQYSESSHDFNYYMVKASVLQHQSDTPSPSALLACYEHALQLKPEHEKALQGYARTLFSQEKYEESLSVYDKLTTLYPEKKSYELNKMVCMTKTGQYEGALNTLFRLHYELPADDNVARVLAWALTCAGRYDQALPLYERLLGSESVAVDDYLNQGYCLWFSGHVESAIDSFRKYIADSGESPSVIIDNERPLITAKGITYPEMMLMLGSI